MDMVESPLGIEGIIGVLGLAVVGHETPRAPGKLGQGGLDDPRAPPIPEGRNEIDISCPGSGPAPSGELF